MSQLAGEKDSDVRAFSVELGAFRDSLASIEEHFKLRNFLVGHSLTLADVYLMHILSGPFKQLFEKKTRLDKLPNLTRFVQLNFDSFFFQFGYSNTQLCKKQAKLPPPKPKEQPAADSKKAECKEQ